MVKESEFNIGDVVWIIETIENKPKAIQKRVFEIDFGQVRKTSNTIIEYELGEVDDSLSETINKYAYSVFPTKEKLLNSL